MLSRSWRPNKTISGQYKLHIWVEKHSFWCFGGMSSIFTQPSTQYDCMTSNTHNSWPAGSVTRAEHCRFQSNVRSWYPKAPSIQVVLSFCAGCQATRDQEQGFCSCRSTRHQLVADLHKCPANRRSLYPIDCGASSFQWLSLGAVEPTVLQEHSSIQVETRVRSRWGKPRPSFHPTAMR